MSLEIIVWAPPGHTGSTFILVVTMTVYSTTQDVTLTNNHCRSCRDCHLNVSLRQPLPSRHAGGAEDCASDKCKKTRRHSSDLAGTRLVFLNVDLSITYSRPQIERHNYIPPGLQGSLNLCRNDGYYSKTACQRTHAEATINLRHQWWLT